MNATRLTHRGTRSSWKLHMSQDSRLTLPVEDSAWVKKKKHHGKGELVNLRRDEEEKKLLWGVERLITISYHQLQPLFESSWDDITLKWLLAELKENLIQNSEINLNILDT